ncbi:DUF4145 domain-containing protein [Pseudomonas protegens]|uniref:DUF4145 domain-containing protein n=1 Tax=Pseudomonas protegens TaxID=380021 RepID=UPI00275589FE|nr:DUF4145 domain-containing protein [Pseudomonas protegens]MDP9518786.1 DUF4145 domain-containing protein [Pseudomonas protegens]
MNKEILKGAFTSNNLPEYKCPHCYAGLLRIDGEFNSKETEASRASHNEDWWEPEHIVLVFSCTLKCTTCSELVFMVGNGVVETDYDVDEHGEWTREYSSFFRPVFFHPALQLIDYPSKAPHEVTVPLATASSLYFSSPASCCNSIRIAAEKILTGLEVPEKDGDKFISFGNRMQLLPDERNSVRELFSAIRWLGNHGSHPGNEVDFDDALHAFEITEYLLEEVYGERKQALKKLADAINDRKGPVSRLQRLSTN